MCFSFLFFSSHLLDERVYVRLYISIEGGLSKSQKNFPIPEKHVVCPVCLSIAWWGGKLVEKMQSTLRERAGQPPPFFSVEHTVFGWFTYRSTGAGAHNIKGKKPNRVVGVHSTVKRKINGKCSIFFFGFDAEYVLHYLSNVFDIFFLFLNKIKK